jgi:glycosyltransferase involved in cell wall biosynthesis
MLHDTVVFAGYVPDAELVHLYNAASAFVLPSLMEGFGLPAIESMACGTPVIVGAVLDAPEFVDDAGILVNPDDIEEMARSILRVLTEPGLREQLSVKAIERSKSFSWEKMAGKTVEVYRDVVMQQAVEKWI